VVGTDVGDVGGAGAVFEDADAVASMPRMIGRLAPLAKPVAAMPGMRASASAMLAPP
jgi:hypothetical protein